MEEEAAAAAERLRVNTMASHGKTVILESGKRGLRETGKGALFNEDGLCSDCCGCEIKVLASAVTNYYYPPWILTPYQGDKQASPDAFWRLIEMGSCYPSMYPWYGFGCVNEDGKLEGLPGAFQSMYPYDGYMQLQIGCERENDKHQVEPHIDWPGSCQTPTPVYRC